MKILKSISNNTQHLYYLDGLRGLAVLMVLSHHTIFRFQNEFYSNQLKNWLDSGNRGVQLFFILSALTLYKSTLTRFETDKWPSLSFYLRRMFRILPFYWLNVLYVAYLFPTPITKILANLTFAFGFIDLNLFMAPGSWSLFVEVCFYALFPIFFVHFLKDSSMVLGALLISIISKLLWQNYMLSRGISLDDINIWGSVFTNFY